MHISIGIEAHDAPENIKALGESLIKLSESFVQQPYPNYTNDVSPPVLKEPAPSITSVLKEPALSVSSVTESDEVKEELSETDSAGFPWDERIHASTKTTNKDGTWKLRKGADKALVEQIRAEFTGVVGNAPVDDNIIEQQQPPADQVGFTQQNTQSDVATVANNTPLNWPTVLQRVMNAKNAGTIDDAAITATLQSLGINGAFPLLANRSDLFESFVTTLGI